METATWTLAGATIALFIAAFIAAIFAFRQLKTMHNQLTLQQRVSDIQLFSELSTDLSSDDASYDRGKVKDIIKPDMNVDDIKKIIKGGRELAEQMVLYQYLGKKSEKEPSNEQLAAKALERTIARFDRIAFFLLNDDNTLRMEPPEWLWTMINDYWNRLHNWIEYRQNFREDSEFYHKGYGIYFSRIANISKSLR